MSYYDTFRKASKSPAQYHRDAMQEFVNYGFENASTYYTDVEEEIAFGTLEFRPINVRINTIVDAKTGQRVNDDYKKIIFKDLNYKPEIGTRYRFDKNIWIVFSTDNLKTDTSSVYVRRCNNTINTQDKYGNIHREPCYIDYKVTETQIFRELRIDVPNGRVWVQCQLNQWTKDININDRFIFGENPYKVRERNKFDFVETFDMNSAKTLSFYADYDEVAPYDNLELGIADYKVYNYIINVPEELNNTINYSNRLSYTVSLDGELVNEDVIFESTNSNILVIDNDGDYKMLKEGECEILVKLKNNPSIFTSVKVVVSNEPNIVYENIITPDDRYIKINKTQNYSVYEYENDTVLDTKFKIECFDMPQKNYLFNKIDDNNFSITNLKTSEDYLLRVVCTNLRTNEAITIYIELGGLF